MGGPVFRYRVVFFALPPGSGGKIGELRVHDGADRPGEDVVYLRWELLSQRLPGDWRAGFCAQQPNRHHPEWAHPLSRQHHSCGWTFSAPAVNFFSSPPAPNAGAPGLTYNNYATSGSGIFDTNQFDVRGDSKLGEVVHTWAATPILDPAFRALLTSALQVETATAQGGFAGTSSWTQPERRGGRRLCSFAQLADRLPLWLLPDLQHRSRP